VSGEGGKFVSHFKVKVVKRKCPKIHLLSSLEKPCPSQRGFLVLLIVSASCVVVKSGSESCLKWSHPLNTYSSWFLVVTEQKQQDRGRSLARGIHCREWGGLLCYVCVQEGFNKN